MRFIVHSHYECIISGHAGCQSHVALGVQDAIHAQAEVLHRVEVHRLSICTTTLLRKEDEPVFVGNRIHID